MTQQISLFYSLILPQNLFIWSSDLLVNFYGRDYPTSPPLSSPSKTN